MADSSADVIMSNCVVNLSPNKDSVYGEAFRVLKPGGRVAISDIVTTVDLPDEARGDLTQYAACISGAASINELTDILTRAGFENIRIQPKDEARDIPDSWKPTLLGKSFFDFHRTVLFSILIKKSKIWCN